MAMNRRETLAALALGTLAWRPAAAAAIPGQPAPDFSHTAADGSRLTLSALRGRTVVLEWTNHDCPYVRKHYESGNLPALQKDATAQGVVWLQVISSAPGTQGHVDAAKARQLNAERGAAPSATLLDPEGQLGRLYGARTTPHLFIVDARGLLAYAGGIDSIASARKEDLARAEPYVRQALADLAAGRAVARATSAPYGCSVKYAPA
jgi:hypothetical protein